MSPPHVNLIRAKESVTRDLQPGHPGREAILAQPDELDVAAFDALFPSLVRLLRLRMEVP
jgi:hypothetical protein